MKKRKIISTIFMTVVCICALAFGVYSVKNASMSASGTIKFDAKEITCTIAASVTGAYDVSGNLIESGNAKTYSGTGDWSGLSWYFNDTTARSLEEVEDIVVTFTITNTGNRSAYAYFTDNTGEFVHFQTLGTAPDYDTARVSLTSRSYVAAATGANDFDVITMQITFTLQEWEALNVDFNYTLHVDDYKSVETPAGDIPRVDTSYTSEETGNEVPFSYYHYVGASPVVYLPETVINDGNILYETNWNMNDDRHYFSAFAGGCYDDWNSCYSYSSTMTNIVIPTTWTSLCDNLFTGCTSLESITIPKSIVSIGNGAFSYCNRLNELIIPSGVRSIGSCIIDESGVNSITIPSTVETLDTYSLSSGYKLCQVRNFSGQSFNRPNDFCEIKTDITNFGNVIKYNRRYVTISANDETYLLGFCSINTSNQLTDIPTGVTRIVGGAFQNENISAENFTIPSSVTYIGGGAFYGCNGDNTSTYIIPSSVAYIGYSAFSDCFANTEAKIQLTAAPSKHWVSVDTDETITTEGNTTVIVDFCQGLLSNGCNNSTTAYQQVSD